MLLLFLLLNVMAAFHAYRFTHFYDDASLVKLKLEDLSFLEKTQMVFFGTRFPKSRTKSQPGLPADRKRLVLYPNPVTNRFAEMKKSSGKRPRKASWLNNQKWAFDRFDN